MFTFKNFTNVYWLGKGHSALCLFVLAVFMHGLVLCLCLSVSVYVCLCPLCALSLFGLGVFMCWSSLHMVANFRRCWKVQRQQLCLGTLPTWGSAQPRCKVNSFNFLHPSFRRNLELICQRRSTSVKGWNVAKNAQSVTHHILYTCPLSLSASPLQPFHAIRLDCPHGHSTWWQKQIANEMCGIIRCSLSISMGWTFNGTSSN